VHVDFQRVSMTERIRLHVAIEQTGTAPILEDPDMILVRRMDTVEIECLPGDIPPSLAADLSKLATLDDTLVAGDLAVPAKVKLVTDPTHVVFSVSVSRAAVEEEEEEEVAEVEPEEVEVMVKGKAAKEEEEIEE
jgi:large subunit ribosomal protein L25